MENTLSGNAPKNQKTQSLKGFASHYLNEVRQCLDEIRLDEVEKIVEMIHAAYLNERNVFILGNGGSASTASHFATDLGNGTAVDGRKRFRAVSLVDNIALISAIGNDLGFERIFTEQLRPALEKEDLVIIISGSGNSPNLVHAASYARSIGARVIGILGFGGGKILSLSDAAVTLQSRHYGHVESVHLVVEHLICNFFMRTLGVAGY